MAKERDASAWTHMVGPELRSYFGNAACGSHQKSELKHAELAGLTQHRTARTNPEPINPTLATIVAVARVLHSDRSYLLREVDPPTE